MATFNLSVNMDNAAFADDPGELRRILLRAAGEVSVGTAGRLVDANGNTVGEWWLTPGTARYPTVRTATG